MQQTSPAAERSDVPAPADLAVGRSDALAVVAETAILLLPGVLVVYLGFVSGGAFPTATGVAAVVVLAAAAARFALARTAFAGLGPLLAVAAVAGALFAGWTLLSSNWSDAPGRAYLELNRDMLYIAVLVLAGSVGWSGERMRWLLRGLLIGTSVVAVAGLLSRVLPDVFHVDLGVRPERLSFPLTYSNAAAIVAAMAAVLSIAHTCDERESPVLRVAGAMVLPLATATLVLTFSRGAIAAGCIGALVYLVFGRPRGAIGGLLAAAPFTALAATSALGAELLGTRTPTSPAAVEQAHGLALTLAVCSVAAGVVRAVLLLVDRRVSRVRVSDAASRRIGIAVPAVTFAGALTVTALLVSSGWVQNQWDGFVNEQPVAHAVQADRFSYLGNNGRLEYIDTALDSWRSDRLKGTGAGTWELEWERTREGAADRFDAHSLYFEVLGELGLVGVLLLGTIFVATFTALAWRARSANRALQMAAFAVALTWSLHAAVDFDWEMAATTVPFFAIAGLAVARSNAAAASGRGWLSAVRLIAAVALLAVAVVPARIAISQARLEQSRTALKADNCTTALAKARSSLDALGVRAEPWEVIGLCEAQARRDGAAVRSLEHAVARDPHNWRYHYSLALVLAVAAKDPMPQVRVATALNPLEALNKLAKIQLRGLRGRRLSDAAERLPLPND